ncbi:hypothetical protein V9K67_20950 [Paraflavisolibacter sp. H34]|uniref:hypothetical protein n=1 Tax=Huijunlia imazamoxiresistens TaxID=3127457 RepID=UPI00301A6184
MRLSRWLQCPLPWINDYLTDFLFVPVTAHISLACMRTFIVCRNSYRYPFRYVLFIAFYAAVVFELILPRIAPVYTGDAGDVVAYFAGGFFYYFVHQGKAGEPAP